MQPTAFEQAALHFCKVAAFVIGSAVVPCVLALYTGNAYWVALTPFINAGAAALIKWSQVQTAAIAASKLPPK